MYKSGWVPKLPIGISPKCGLPLFLEYMYNSYCSNIHHFFTIYAYHSYAIESSLIYSINHIEIDGKALIGLPSITYKHRRQNKKPICTL